RHARMTQPSDLVSKLLNSSAYHSIQSEQEVVLQIRSNGWLSSHGAFYSDVVTGKIREVDAVGVRRWEKKNKRDEISVTFNLLVEVKSARDSHVLVSGV